MHDNLIYWVLPICIFLCHYDPLNKKNEKNRLRKFVLSTDDNSKSFGILKVWVKCFIRVRFVV